MTTATEQKFILRRPRPADSGRVREIARETWEATYARNVLPSNRARIVSLSYSDEALRRAFRPSKRHQWFWLAEDAAGQVLGFAETVMRPGAIDAELTRIYVLPSVQGQGLGRALVGALLADLRGLPPDLKPPRLYLSVAADNRAAIDFYEKRGFHHSRDFQANLPGQRLEMREYMIEV